LAVLRQRGDFVRARILLAVVVKCH
jgi:hypothetical protein